MVRVPKRSQGQDEPPVKPKRRGFPIRGLVSALDAVSGFVPFALPVSHAVTNALERSEVCKHSTPSAFY